MKHFARLPSRLHVVTKSERKCTPRGRNTNRGKEENSFSRVVRKEREKIETPLNTSLYKIRLTINLKEKVTRE
jgi:hypothetical protein